MVTLAHLVILACSLAKKYNENVKVFIVYDMIIYVVKIFKIFNVFYYAFGFSLLKLLFNLTQNDSQQSVDYMWKAKLIWKHDLKVPMWVTEVYIKYKLQFQWNLFDIVNNRRLLLWKISPLLWSLLYKRTKMIPKFNCLLKAIEKYFSGRIFIYCSERGIF